VVYSQWRLGAHSALGLPSLSDRIVDFVRVTTAADGEASAFLDPLYILVGLADGGFFEKKEHPRYDEDVAGAKMQRPR
jgi:hypothetical protein